MRSRQASYKRIENIDCSKQKCSRAARRVENSDLLDGVPEGAQEFRTFAILDHILRELSDVEVKSDQHIDLTDFPAREFSLDLLVDALDA